MISVDVINEKSSLTTVSNCAVSSASDLDESLFRVNAELRASAEECERCSVVERERDAWSEIARSRFLIHPFGRAHSLI